MAVGEASGERARPTFITPDPYRGPPQAVCAVSCTRKKTGNVTLMILRTGQTPHEPKSVP